MKKRVDDPGTFVTNRGYHCDEEAKRHWLTPSLAIKTGRRTAEHVVEPQPFHVRPTASNDDDWVARKPLPPISAFFDASGTTCVEAWRLKQGDRRRVVGFV